MNVIKNGSLFVFVLLAGVVSIVLGCGGGGGAVNGNPPSDGVSFTPVTQNITTTWRIRVVNGSTGLPIVGATFGWSAASEPTSAYHDPAWFLGQLSATYQTNASGEIVLTGTTSVPNAGFNFPYIMNYNWTCSAPSLQTASGYQEFPTSSWLFVSQTLSASSPSSSDYSGTLVQQVVLNPVLPPAS